MISVPKSNRYSQAHFISSQLDEAIAETVRQLRDDFSGQTIDLVVAFFAGYPSTQLDRHLIDIQQATEAITVIGCSCETVVSGASELENESAISLWAAGFPNGKVDAMHLEFQTVTDGSAIVGWPKQCEGPWPEDAFLIVLGEPFGFPAEVLLERMNEDRPGMKLIGGMASGANQPGEARLLLNEEVFQTGAVAVRISGVSIETVVSQGCRPIGEPMIITTAERNMIEGLGGVPALSQLRTVFAELPTRDQRLVQNGLHIGRVINEYQEKFAYGDFLVRNVVGIDSESEIISIGDYVRPGQTVQFHIRDAESADAELASMLGQLADRNFTAALLFTCNGRGMNLFSDPDHDAQMIRSKFGIIPTAGFFASGEIGPVGQQNFMHGFTASLVLFE
jgi:small ligand-binding sensory domain FIST